MAKAKRLLTNFSKGELSPLIEGRPDLAAYFEGGKTLENWVILRQGGVTRRPGTRFIKEVKDSTKDTILLPFEFSVDDAFIIEMGNVYARFYKNKAQLTTSAGGPAVEVVSPYTEAQLRNIHYTQSADVMFMFHPSVQQRKLSRVSDTNWSLSAITYLPPPSFEADTDISGGATLTPGATTGTSVIFTASVAVFLEGDVGRQIIFGAARATIVAFGASAGDAGTPNDQVRADILDAFPNTNPIATGSWLLRLSPQATLDPDIKEPVNAQVTLVAGKNTFRTADVGKFIEIYGGLVKITVRDSVTQVKGEILSVMSDATTANPAAAPAGAWSLREASWSTANGFPRTGEFFQGRLGQAGTGKQPTNFWLSASDDFDNYAIGSLASNAVEYTIASRKVNIIEWLADNLNLFIGTVGAEFEAKGGKTEEPIGGDIIPLVRRITTHGCAPIQPTVLNKRIIFVDRSKTQIWSMAFDIEQDGFDAFELTGPAEHITGSGIRLGSISVVNRLHPRVYFVRDDGVIVVLTFFPKEKVIGFTRLVTDGLFESVAAIPGSSGQSDQVWVIVKRVINGVTKRYIEMFEEYASEFSTRAWTSLQTDCAIAQDGAPIATVTGLSHLEGKTVDVIADGAFRGTYVVSGGVINLTTSASKIEVGLHYNSTGVTMRPAIENTIIEGLPRSWNDLHIRLYNTIGGKLNGKFITYPASPLGSLTLYTGDRKITGQGWDTEGRITFEQTQPYPMTVLALFGELEVGDHA